MKIFIASDHAAFEGKEALKSHLASTHEIIDLGPDSAERCDYPDFASALAKKVQAEKVPGILLCGSGIGVSIVANRYKGIRAALCRTTNDAELSRQHNDSNVLCVGARVNSDEEIAAITDAWLKAEFEGGRHSDRLALFENLGE